MKISYLIWSERSEEHIARHGVTWGEVEEDCFESKYRLRKGKGNMYLVYGHTKAGRYLLIVLSPRGRGEFYVVSARDMTAREKRLYRRK